MGHDYEKWHKTLSKELCDYMDCFEKAPRPETLYKAEKIAKTIKTLYEVEAYELMFDCLEDCFGYDREEHEFCDKDGGTDYILYAIHNAYNPGRMTRGTSHYPTIGQGYGTGVDHRYGEYSTDKAMYPGYGMGGWMNAYDGRSGGSTMTRGARTTTGGQGGRTGGMTGRTGDYQNTYMPDDYPYYDDWEDEDGRFGEYRNAVRGGSRGGSRRRRDTRGRYIMNAAERKETKEKLHKLSDEDKKRWVSEMVSFDGSVGGPWSMSEVEAVAKRIGVKYEDFTPSDLYVAANLLYTDMGEALANQPNANKPETWIKMAALWLSDEDGLKGDERLSAYYQNIVDDDD